MKPTLSDFTNDTSMNALVLFDDEYGAPNATAYRIWEAIERRLSHDPATTRIYLSKSELLHLTGMVKGGSAYKRIATALHQLRRVDIHYRTRLFLGHKNNQEKQCHLIDFEKDILPDRSQQECYRIDVDPVWAKIYGRGRLQSFNQTLFAGLSPMLHSYATIVNYKLTTRYQRAQAQESYDENWNYTINYEDYLSWIFSPLPYTAPRTIFTHQIEEKATPLLEAKYLAEMPKVVPRKPDKNNKRDKPRWKIVFKPGEQFFIDYHRFYGPAKAELDDVPDDASAKQDNPDGSNHTSRPTQHSDAKTPVAKKTGTAEVIPLFGQHQPSRSTKPDDAHSPATEQTEAAQVITLFGQLFSPDKEIAPSDTATKFANQLIKKFDGLEPALSFIRWAVPKAAKTFPDMRVIGGLKNLIDEYQKQKSRTPTVQTAQEREKAMDEEARLKARYDRYCRTAIELKVAEMSGAELIAFQEQVKRTLEQISGMPGTTNPKKIEERVKIDQLVRTGLLEDYIPWRQRELCRLR